MMRQALKIGLVVTMSLFLGVPTTSAGAVTATATTRARVKAAGISLKYPSDWTALPLTKARFSAMLKVMSKKNPNLADAMASVDVSKVEFFALDTLGSPVTSNIVVNKANYDLRGLSRAEFKALVGPSFKSVGATSFDAKLTKVDGRNAYRTEVTLPIKLPDGTSIVEAQVGLIIPHGGSSTVVTVTANNDAEGAALANEVINSVHNL